MLSKLKTEKGEQSADENIVKISQKLNNNRRDEIKAFSIALQDEGLKKLISNDNGNQAFSQLLNLSINEYGVSQKELALAIDVNPTTVGRWCNGSSLPPLYGRVSIINAIVMVINHALI